MDDRITRLLKCALEMEFTPWPAPRRRLLAYAMAALLGHMEGLPPQEQLLLEAAAILHGHSEPQMVLTQTGVWLKEEMKRIFMLLEGKGSSPAARLLADALRLAHLASENAPAAKDVNLTSRLLYSRSARHIMDVLGGRQAGGPMIIPDAGPRHGWC